MSAPDVSVVIAVKNEEVYVESALLSVLNQGGLNFEVLVVDDGSTDNTWNILSGISHDYPQLKIFKNPKAGKCSAFNYGVLNASGRFLCIYAGDDIMPAGSLAARFGKVKAFADAPVVGLCKLVTMSEDKKFDGHLVPKRAGQGGLTGVSYMMSQKVVDKIFPVPETLPNEDTWMELAVTSFDDWNVVHSDIVGCQWRVHSGNSINMLVDFDTYNNKLTPRMAAIRIFYDRHGDQLSPASKNKLYQKVICEERRAKGDVLGVMTAKIDLISRLRALSACNRFFYNLRRRLYGLLSGW